MKFLFSILVILLQAGSITSSADIKDVPVKKTSDKSVRIDHFVVGIPELQKGIDEFFKAAGVKPVLGGKHPFFGTHNALVSLGYRLYLEILAPLPGLDTGIYAKLNKLTPLSWAVSTDSIEDLKEKLKKQGFESTDIIPGFRTTPDGSKLEWSALMILKPAIKGVPFFIQWKGKSIHPSKNSPPGCKLKTFEILTPTARELKRLLAVLSIRLKVKQSPFTKLLIILKSPKGEVRF